MSDHDRYAKITRDVDKFAKVFPGAPVKLNSADFDVLSKRRPEAVIRHFPDKILYREAITIERIKKKSVFDNE